MAKMEKDAENNEEEMKKWKKEAEKLKKEAEIYHVEKKKLEKRVNLSDGVIEALLNKNSSTKVRTPAIYEPL